MDNIDAFPTEILLKIFSTLDDRSLINLRLVCKRFKEISDDTIIKKYDGNWYTVHECAPQNVNSFILKHASDVTINFIGPIIKASHWIYQWINRCGENLQKIQLDSLRADERKPLSQIEALDVFLKSTVTHLFLKNVQIIDMEKLKGKTFPHVKHLEISNFIDLSQHPYFLQHFPQLEHFSMVNNMRKIHCAPYISHLKHLECLVSSNHSELFTAPPMRKVKKLKIYLQDENDYASPEESDEEREGIDEGVRFPLLIKNIIKKYPNVEDLRLSKWGYVTTCDDIDDLCSMTKLKHLAINYFNFTIDQIKKIILSLPNLISIDIRHDEYELSQVAKFIVMEAKKHANLKEVDLRIGGVAYEQSRNAFGLFEWLIQNIDDELELTFSHGNKTPIVAKDGELYLNGVVFKQNDFEEYDDSERSKLKLKKIAEIIDVRKHKELLKIYEAYNYLRVVAEKLFENRYRDEYIHISELTVSEAERFFKYFGKYMKRAYVSQEYFSTFYQAPPIMRLYQLNCAKTLIEMEIRAEQCRLDTSHNWLFPELLTLEIDTNGVIDYNWLDVLRCPKLQQLEIVDLHYLPDKFIEERASVHSGWNQANLFSNLSTLILVHPFIAVVDLLDTLDAKVCENLRQLKLKTTGKNVFDDRAIGAIAKCSNLEVLHVTISDLGRKNKRYLFEGCSKLKMLFLDGDFQKKLNIPERIIESIIQNCGQLESLKFANNHRQSRIGDLLPNIKELFPNTKVEIENFKNKQNIYPLDNYLLSKKPRMD